MSSLTTQPSTTNPPDAMTAMGPLRCPPRAGLALVWILLGVAGFDQGSLLIGAYDHGGRWVLQIVSIAVGIVLGLRVDRLLESNRSHGSVDESGVVRRHRP